MANKLIVVALLFVAIVGINAAEAPAAAPDAAISFAPSQGLMAKSLEELLGSIAESPEGLLGSIAESPEGLLGPIAESPEGLLGPIAESIEELASTVSDSLVHAPVVAPTASNTPSDAGVASSAITVKISSVVVAAAIFGFFSL